jgi:hypothetical protein
MIANVVLFFITSDYIISFWLNYIKRHNVLVSLRYKKYVITRMRIDLANTHKTFVEESIKRKAASNKL